MVIIRLATFDLVYWGEVGYGYNMNTTCIAFDTRVSNMFMFFTLVGVTNLFQRSFNQ